WDFVNPEIVMIGTEDGKTSGDAALLVDFYKSIMENDPEYIIGTWDECECIKVFYNTFISTKIAFVNMIQDVAVKQGNINANFVASSLTKCHQRLISDKYMKPGMGDGGSCHPRDNTALRYLSDSLNLGYDMFGHIMFVREKQAENMAKEILKMSKIVHFSSDSYKDGVASTDGSYSLLVQHFILKHGGSLVNSRDCEVFVKVHESDVVPDNKMVFDVWKDYGNKY
ncbi:MAG: UDP-glucose/GDP-mannose dehydrogenase family protein, partial [Gammaproteobacteria bacterium]|nr:UDP-glucose/GDP-mannose dehydrogenase family protein [Gammaproteobacteria bacterium]